MELKREKLTRYSPWTRSVLTACVKDEKCLCCDAVVCCGADYTGIWYQCDLKRTKPCKLPKWAIGFLLWLKDLRKTQTGVEKIADTKAEGSTIIRDQTARTENFYIGVDLASEEEAQRYLFSANRVKKWHGF